MSLLKKGMFMRQYDLSPLYRSTVGFDRLFTMLDQASDASVGYPPYNIERTGEHDYRITVAVAGFAETDLAIESREHALTIRGSRDAQPGQEPAKQPAKREVLHQGIAARSFERRFQLADHVMVVGASLENGLLHVDLVREIPEAQKPRRIPIGRATAPRAVEVSTETSKAA